MGYFLPASAGKIKPALTQIDHRDFEQVLHAYDSPTTCFYLDPPYIGETRRKQRCYHHEMSIDDHKRLLACIQSVEGMVILSGYAHPLYQEALASWECLKLTLACSSAVRAYDVQCQLSQDTVTRTECIWMNEVCVRNQQSLFRDLLFQPSAS